MCTVPPDSLQAVDSLYLKALEKLNYYNKAPCLSNACDASEFVMCPHKDRALLVKAAHVCRSLACRVHALNATRIGTPRTYAESVVENILRATLIILNQETFDQRLADEALILSNHMPNSITNSILDLISEHNNVNCHQSAINESMFYEEAKARPAKDSCPVTHDIGDFRKSLYTDCPCVLRKAVTIDSQSVLKQIMNAAPVRWVPAECGASDFRASSWNYSIKLLENAILEGNYVAQFPLHQHLNLDLSDVSHFLAELRSQVGQVESNCWFGPADTRSPHHVDPQPNIYVAVHGFKFFQIVKPDASTDDLIMKPLSGSLRNVSSAANAVLKNKNLQSWNVTLHRGDALYIPQGHWHMAQSLSWHLGVSSWYQKA